MQSTKTTQNSAGLVVSTSEKMLLGVMGYNAKTSGQFIQFFDALEAPEDGSVPEFMVFAEPSSTFSLDLGYHGIRFKTGVYVCNSSTQQTKTIGSADCWFNVQTRDLNSADYA